MPPDPSLRRWDLGMRLSKRASETREQTLLGQEQNRTHLACVEGSALQCCSLQWHLCCGFEQCEECERCTGG